jgi:microsomal epoxide hydrolase
MHKVIGPLTDPAAYGGDPADAFDLIVPSLPGFGFSTPLPSAPMNFVKTADIWHKLMTETLGFNRYAAAGGDWGATVTEQLGHKYASSLYGIHSIHPVPLTLHNSKQYWNLAAGMIPPGMPDEIADPIIRAIMPSISHFCVQTLDSQTLAYAMHDSPVGQLAWLARRRRDWGDPRTNWHDPAEIEHLITLALIYWVTDSFVTTARYYTDAARYPWTPSHPRMPTVEAPTGFTFLHGEGTGRRDIAAFRESPLAKDFNLHFLAEHDFGGHFGHYENPTAVVHDIRAMFRDLR